MITLHASTVLANTGFDSGRGLVLGAILLLLGGGFLYASRKNDSN